MNRLDWYINASIEFHLNFDVSIFLDWYNLVFHMEKNV